MKFPNPSRVYEDVVNVLLEAGPEATPFSMAEEVLRRGRADTYLTYRICKDLIKILSGQDPFSSRNVQLAPAEGSQLDDLLERWKSHPEWVTTKGGAPDSGP